MSGGQRFEPAVAVAGGAVESVGAALCYLANDARHDRTRASSAAFSDASSFFEMRSSSAVLDLRSSSAALNLLQSIAATFCPEALAPIATVWSRLSDFQIGSLSDGHATEPRVLSRECAFAGRKSSGAMTSMKRPNSPSVTLEILQLSGNRGSREGSNGYSGAAAFACPKRSTPTSWGRRFFGESSKYTAATATRITPQPIALFVIESPARQLSSLAPPSRTAAHFSRSGIDHHGLRRSQRNPDCHQSGV